MVLLLSLGWAAKRRLSRLREAWSTLQHNHQKVIQKIIAFLIITVNIYILILVSSNIVVPIRGPIFYVLYQMHLQRCPSNPGNGSTQLHVIVLLERVQPIWNHLNHPSFNTWKVRTFINKLLISISSIISCISCNASANFFVTITIYPLTETISPATH